MDINKTERINQAEEGGQNTPKRKTVFEERNAWPPMILWEAVHHQFG